MVMPRAFSSGRRSVSTPVSARTSVVLPWSICPAVPTIMGWRPFDAPNEAKGLAVRRTQLMCDGDAAEDLTTESAEHTEDEMKPAGLRCGKLRLCVLCALCG